MGRIHTYETDNEINGNDKLLGSEYATNATKNYVINDVADFFVENNKVSGGGAKNYKFVISANEFKAGRFMVSANGGEGVPMASLQTIYIHKQCLGVGNIEQLLRKFFSSTVNIYGQEEANTYGEYSVLNISDEDTALAVSLSPMDTNGVLANDKHYAISDNTAGDKTFTFAQSTPASTWIIDHNLNKKPSVSVVDTGGNLCYGEVVHNSNNRLTVTFSASFAGEAYIN